MSTIDDAITRATAHGWTDDTRWTPNKIAHQISTVTHGILAAVRVHTDGTINWRVTRHDDTAPTLPLQRHGDAPNVAAAIAACDQTVTAALGTLF